MSKAKPKEKANDHALVGNLQDALAAYANGKGDDAAKAVVAAVKAIAEA